MHRHPLYRALATMLTTLAGSQVVFADHLEELVVSASHDTRTIEVSDTILISADVAQLLKEAPGANVNSNGPITGIPQYRGMFGQRIATSLDGNQLAPAGPNWMDPPISYALTAQLESLEIYRGIAPVSVAQESIGGAIDARTRQGEFSNSADIKVSGSAMASAQSVNEGYQVDADLYMANRQHRLKLAAMSQAGDDADFPGGQITPTEYERQRYDIGYGFRYNEHSLQLNYGYNDTGEAGTPALPMDIDYVEGDLYDLTYRFFLDNDIEVKASIYASELDHGMTNYHLRVAPEPGNWRRNIAASDNIGIDLYTRLYDRTGHWTFGFDGLKSTHDSNIDNPNNAAFFVVNFNKADREVLGAFLERHHTFNDQWQGEFGIRYNRVTMDADDVDGTPAQMGTPMMGMAPPGQQLRDDFNNADRLRRDNNIDLVAKAWYQTSEATSWYMGFAQKHRSASYQERYLWLPLEATAGLADGMTYVGDIRLKPERSWLLEAGLDFSNGSFSVSPRIFYNDVENYIQGIEMDDSEAAVRFVRMMNNMNGTNRPDPLQFANVEAELYGFDMDWAWQMGANWTLSGLVNYVRGKRGDIDDNLYRIAPANGSLRLGYNASNWNARIEGVAYADQDKVSATNMERKTPGYGVVNLGGTWQATPRLQFAAGVDNLFDKQFQNHLGGYNRATNPDIPKGSRLPGYGINTYARVRYEF